MVTAAIPDDAWHAIEYTDASIGKFTANAAWLVLSVMAFNLTSAAATLTGTTMAKATTATIRRITFQPGSRPPLGA